MLDLDPTAIRSIDGAEDVRTALAERVQNVLAEDGDDRCIRRVEVAVSADMPPLDWVRAQEETEAAYWSGRDDAQTVATVGAADVVASTDAPIDYGTLHRRLIDRLSGAPEAVRYYGGLRFDAAQVPGSKTPSRFWAPFGTYRFVLPRFELVKTDRGTVLACNLVLPCDAGQTRSIIESVHRLALPVPDSPAALPQPRERTDVPDQSGWTRMVRWALDAIEENALDKVVLARRVALKLGTSIDPLLVLRHLEGATPGCFHFAVRPDAGPAFVGASPERLFRRAGNRVVSEAVAGTRSRGDSPEADAALRDELLHSPKERREHAFVQEAIRSVLDELCTTVEVPGEASELALARGRHLHARLSGTLQSSTSTVDLLTSLHPTPAVGGVPRHEALTAIRSQEPFDRGWYAGPVGWIGRETAEFAVAIRSGLVHPTRLALFSGAGIVEGSAPAREWEEIEQKIGDFAAILGLDGHTEGSA